MTLDEVATLLAESGQPHSLYEWLHDETKRLIGHKLFTLLVIDGGESARIYTSDAKAYPVGGRKLRNQTAWAEVVIGAKRPWLGGSMAEIRWAFTDHKTIASLGCGACINVPVVYDGAVIGTMNILDAEGAYDEQSVARVAPLAPLLIPAFLLASRA